MFFQGYSRFIHALFNELGDDIECTFIKFANGRKLGGMAHIPDGCAATQRDLSRLGN